MRRLLPRFLYPGRRRVGTDISAIALPDGVRAYDGVDWFWLPSLLGALRFLRREKPDVLVLQWWTGTVLHSFLALALAARRRGARVVIEFHESLDTGEDRVALFSRYVNLLAPRLFRMAQEYVVHSEFDRDLIVGRFGLPADAFHVVPHASYDTYTDAADEVRRDAPDGVTNLLYFGIIRPFKGVEDLVRAFDSLPDDVADRFWLTVVGETWEGHTLPADLIAASPRKDRITFVNRYVQDHEVDAFFRGADVVVLPYHRSSMSGPLQVAMNYGLPLVVTRVGGLVEAVSGYGGAVLVEPQDPGSLRDGILRAADMLGERFATPHDWAATRELYGEVISAALAG
jgi:glycosyltransferase involved in cell wall biosynthesis